MATPPNQPDTDCASRKEDIYEVKVRALSEKVPLRAHRIKGIEIRNRSRVS